MTKAKKKDKEKYDDLFERYKILVNARNFHYENFNKWLTYFYVANAAIFVGYIQILTSDKNNLEYLNLPVLILGLIAGLLLYWSSKGYYYWNINFIMLVNHYEKNLLKWNKKERIYSMFANKVEQNNFKSPFSGANFSTSKIAILFAFIIVSTWGTLLVYTIFNNTVILKFINCKCLVGIISTFLSMTFIIGLTWLIGLKKKHFLWSNTDPLYDLNLPQDVEEEIEQIQQTN
jgi:hypothetical protein